MGAISILLGMEMEETHWELQTSNVVSLGGSAEAAVTAVLPGAGSLFLLGCFSSSCYCHSTPEPINNSWIQHQGDKQVHTCCIPVFGPKLMVLRNSIWSSQALRWFMASSFSFLLIFSQVTWLWCELALSRKAISHSWAITKRSGHLPKLSHFYCL